MKGICWKTLAQGGGHGSVARGSVSVKANGTVSFVKL